MGREDWTSVGQEELFSVVNERDDTAAVVICDSEGNTKAISGWLSRGDAERFATTLESRGHPRYDGEVKLPVQGGSEVFGW